MTSYRFSVEIDSTSTPDRLLTELRRICDLAFPEVRVAQVSVSQRFPNRLHEPERQARLREALAGHYPAID